MTLESLRARFLFHVMFNAYWQPLAFELPPTASEGQRWQRCLDTALVSPDDIRSLTEAPTITGSRYVVEPRSVVLLAMSLQSSPAV
jgi:glycogen operon protein